MNGPESTPNLLIPSYYYFLLLSASGIFSHEELKIQEDTAGYTSL